MLDESQGPLMIDLTDLVKRRPVRKPAFGTMIALRDVAVGSIGVLVALPFVMFFYGAGLPVIGNLVAIAGIVASLFLGASKPDGQTIPEYARAALRGRVGRVEVDGEKVRVHVGICPVERYHDGSPQVIQWSAVRVDPAKVGPRGNFLATPEATPGLELLTRDDPAEEQPRLLGADGLPVADTTSTASLTKVG